MSNEQTALDVQVGGDHYKKLKIQPIEYIHANQLPYCEANVIKYISRWRDKGGGVAAPGRGDGGAKVAEEVASGVFREGLFHESVR